MLASRVRRVRGSSLSWPSRWIVQPVAGRREVMGLRAPPPPCWPLWPPSGRSSLVSLHPCGCEPDRTPNVTTAAPNVQGETSCCFRSTSTPVAVGMVVASWRSVVHRRLPLRCGDVEWRRLGALRESARDSCPVKLSDPGGSGRRAVCRPNVGRLVLTNHSLRDGAEGGHAADDLGGTRGVPDLPSMSGADAKFLQRVAQVAGRSASLRRCSSSSFGGRRLLNASKRKHFRLVVGRRHVRAARPAIRSGGPPCYAELSVPGGRSDSSPSSVTGYARPRTPRLAQEDADCRLRHPDDPLEKHMPRPCLRGTARARRSRCGHGATAMRSCRDDGAADPGCTDPPAVAPSVFRRTVRAGPSRQGA